MILETLIQEHQLLPKAGFCPFFSEVLLNVVEENAVEYTLQMVGGTGLRHFLGSS
jgi:hypothetical protein